MLFSAFTAPDLQPLHTDVPLSGVSISEEANTAVSLDATLDAARAYEEIFLSDTGETVPLIRERGTVLVASDGDQRWAFLVTAAPRDAEDQERIRIQGLGHGGLPDSVPWLSSAESLVEVDALDIVRMVWGEVTDRDDSLSVTVDDTRSGVLLGEELREVEGETSEGEEFAFEAGPYKLNWWSVDDLKQTLDDLAEETPFEWRERVDFDPSSEEPPSFHIELGSPRLPVREKEHLRFELGLNVSSPEPPEKAGAFTEVLVIGNGEGSEKVRAKASRNVPWQRTVKVISDQSITSNRQARQVANDAVEDADREARWIETCTVVEHPAAPLTAFGLGDVITVQGETAWGFQRQVCRITAITRSIDDATASLTLGRWRN